MIMKLKITGAILALFIIIQFIPYGWDHANPKKVSEPQWNSEKTRTTFFRLCGDCHSNETTWPVYSYIAPISWLVQHDVEEGREHFNVSMWNVQKSNKGDEAAEEYEKGEMPPWLYQLPRPGTKLSPEEKSEFLQGLKTTFGEEK
jgi:hypothetical protein